MKRLGLFLLLLAPGAGAQDLYPWLRELAGKELAARRTELEALRTPEQIRARGAATRAKLLRWIGGLPGERTPLRLQRTPAAARRGYRIEKIRFESQPGLVVTATLHLPEGAGPFPAVLQPTGHSLAAKARGLYQSLAIDLARAGMAVLTYDPLGQGERRVFFDAGLGDSIVGGPTVEHQMLGVQALLAGESIARTMIWDGIRALDLLASLPEVDGKRLAVSGCSGGGTLTAYLAAIDDRVQVAAPSCYITSWEEQLAGTGPQDAEQQFPDQLVGGYDHGDLIVAAAPKPYLISATTEDFFPIAGTRRTFGEIKRLYDRMGAEDKLSLYVGPGDHGMRGGTRAAVTAWMRKWLCGERGAVAGPESGVEREVEFEEDLNVTPTGQVSTSGGATASAVLVARYKEIPTPERFGDLERRVEKLTRFTRPPGAPAFETVRSETVGGIAVETLRWEAEPGRFVPAALYRPAGARAQPVLVADAAGRGSAVARELAGKGYTVLAIDTALTGETAHKARSYAEAWFPQDKAIWLTLMVGRTVTGLRMADVVSGIEVLAARGLVGPEGVAGVGIGNPGVALLHAAVGEPRLRRLVLEGMPVSYRALAISPVQRRVFDLAVPGVLREYDLPQLAAALGTREVILSNTVGPEGTVLGRPEVAAVYRSANVRAERRREAESVAGRFFPQ